MGKQFQNKAFSKKTPSLFILDTPFQLLCAMEAIKEFEIDDYMIIAAFEHGEKRNEQVLLMLNEQNLKYRIEWVTDYCGMVNNCVNNYKSWKLENEGEEKWERIYIGNYNALDQWVSATKYAVNNTVLVFLDDGSSSVELLKKGCGKNGACETQFIKIWEHIGLKFGPFIFTVFSDIRTKKILKYQNSFSNILSAKLNINQSNGIYVIGTNSKPYGNAVGLSVPEYEGLLWRKLSELKRKYPNDEIVYIPHGRDTNTIVEKFCELLGIKFQQIDCAVEYFFLKNGVIAKAIYGFGSTALFTLKKLTSTACVVNWFVDNPNGISYYDYRNTAKYYERHGIILDRISVSYTTTFKRYKNRIKANFRNIFK